MSIYFLWPGTEDIRSNSINGASHVLLRFSCRNSLISSSLACDVHVHVCVCVCAICVSRMGVRNVGQTVVNKYFYNKFLLTEEKQWQKRLFVTFDAWWATWRSMIALDSRTVQQITTF